MTSEFKGLIWTPSPMEIQTQKDWIVVQISEIGMPALKELALMASEARNLSYSPYSKYKVGAAILTTSGEKYPGQNIEVASFSETGHAEEQAIKNAVAGGAIQKDGRKFLKAVAVSHEGDTAPCGRCRQIIVEFCDNALVIVADTEGNIRKVTSAKLLLPYAFTPSDLGFE